MLPFPDPLSNPLVPDPALQSAFNAAMAVSPAPLPAVPFTIVALNDPDDGGAPHGFAGQLGSDMHYSASLLKVAAMYAAFALRKAANDLLGAQNPPAAGVFPVLRAAFDAVILGNLVPQLNGVDPQFFLPKYEQVFAVQPPQNGIISVNFTPGFFGHLHDAIAKSNNAGAAECIHGLGYGYLTGALTAAGLFDAATSKGIWLCGDFGFGFPRVRIESVNDGPVAQSMSTTPMARLYTLLFDRSLVGPESSDAMLGLLAAAVPLGHFLLSRTSGLNFATFNTKIGLGPLKTGVQVASEGSILRHVGTGRSFVAVWQNRVFANDASIAPVSRVVAETITTFLA